MNSTAASCTAAKENGTWKPSRDEHAAWALEYAKALEAGGKYKICVWPEHCLVGIKGTVRRNYDGHIIHANVDTDVMLSEEPPPAWDPMPEWETSERTLALHQLEGAIARQKHRCKWEATTGRWKPWDPNAQPAAVAIRPGSQQVSKHMSRQASQVIKSESAT